MFKFLDRAKFLTVVNSWIRDGSKLESFGSYEGAEWVVLRGRDGAREEFYLYHEKAEYDLAVHYQEWSE